MGENQQVDEEVSYWQRRVAESGEGAPERPELLVNLARSLRTRFLQTGQAADLDHAVRACEEALQLPRPGPEQTAEALSCLGQALREKYHNTGSVEHLERALDAFRTALITLPATSPEAGNHHSNLGCTLSEKYIHLGNLQDLTLGIEHLRCALALAPLGSPESMPFLNNLGLSLLYRYGNGGDPRDLDEAIEMHSRVLELAPADSAELFRYLSNLATALLRRYAKSGSVIDLDRAIELHRRAVARMAPTAVHLPGYLSHLAGALGGRYELAGNESDLEESIAVYHRAVELTPPQSTELPAHLGGLALAYRARYRRTGNISSLTQCVDLLESAVAKTRPDSTILPNLFRALGIALRERFRRMGNVSDLERAIGLHERAVQRLSTRSPELPLLLTNLGNALLDRYLCKGDPGDLNRAIEQGERALTVETPTAPVMAGHLLSLAGALRVRYARKGEFNDLERAAALCGRATGLLEPTSWFSASCFGTLGNIFQDRHKRTNEASDRARSVDAYRKAIALQLELVPVDVIATANNWAPWAENRNAWDEAEEAYVPALGVAERLFQTHLLRGDRENWLRHIRGLHARAGFSFAQCGHSDAAAVALEKGRALFLNEALQRSRADLLRLRDLGRVDLHEAYALAANRVLELEREEFDLSDHHRSRVELVELLASARLEFENVLAEIRRVPGYELFLVPVTFDQIRLAAATQPIVYAAATERGGLAVIVRNKPDSSATVLWLPDLIVTELAERVREYFKAYDQEHKTWLKVYEEITQWLWRVLMGPLADSLSSLNSVRLVPTGLLGFLPLHSAWTVDPTTRTGRRYFLDQITVTYQPSARGIPEAADSATRVPLDAILAVQEPLPCSSGALPSAAREVEAAVSTFSRHRIMRHSEATREEVLDALPSYPVIHLACHGFADLRNPLASGLVMAGDKILTVGDILGLQFGCSRLAVLSACETGVPGADLPDELVGLSGGLIQAGVPGVVASLWSVDDMSTMMLMVKFYELWRIGRVEPSEALRQAELWVRDTTNSEKASYFQVLSSGSAWHRNTAAIGNELRARIMHLKPEDREFQHPFHWAAFCYFGV